MKLTINGIEENTQANNLQDLLAEREQTQPWIATAVNGELIPANKRQSYILQNNDNIEILSPMQGG